MSWYVKTESQESQRHTASTIFHGPIHYDVARAFVHGVRYVDDPTMSAQVVSSAYIPEGACVRELCLT